MTKKNECIIFPPCGHARTCEECATRIKSLVPTAENWCQKPFKFICKKLYRFVLVVWDCLIFTWWYIVRVDNALCIYIWLHTWLFIYLIGLNCQRCYEIHDFPLNTPFAKFSKNFMPPRPLRLACQCALYSSQKCALSSYASLFVATEH